MRTNTDRLTGLLNHGAFRERVEQELERARRYNNLFSQAFIDLDNFKQVNDTQGHASGDRLLQRFSAAITGAIRRTDIAARVGGDEFTVFFPETGESQVRTAIAQGRALETMTGSSGSQVTASIGVITCSDTRESYDSLLGKADNLMYAAKNKGKNAAEFRTLA